MLTGNKGEWSEIYVLFRLLAEGKIYAADADLKRLQDIYFPILKIIRDKNEYIPENLTVKVLVDNEEVFSAPASTFQEEADYLLSELKTNKGRSFDIPRSEGFMNEIRCFKLSAPSAQKADITMEIIDINTGYNPIVGFSIKSELGLAPTLLNAGKTTNFIYKINHHTENLVQETNAIFSIRGKKRHTNIRGRIENIIQNEGVLDYSDMENQTFKDNLILIDSCMDKIIAHTLLYYYRDGIADCTELIKKLEEENPLNYGNINAYAYKFKKFLAAVALGMRPATIWNGIDEASGGYIVVTEDGDVIAYHIYNRNFFENYLLKNTKYETASTSRHEFGEVYHENFADFIKLNLQIRFKK